MNDTKRLWPITFILVTLNIILISCQEHKPQIKNVNDQYKIVDKYLKNGAWNHHYLTKEWEKWINKGLECDSTIAYLWQQKAIPYWKQKKYQLAISYYDKAVLYDRQEWLSRLAILKCIFAKDYNSSIIDINNYLSEFGSTYEQDHSLELYLGISYLQLNQYANAFRVLKGNIDSQEKIFGSESVHYLDRYYLAIVYYELNNYNLANAELDKVLIEYSNFSDAQFYKSICLKHIGNSTKAKELMILGKSNFKKGYTFNEDSNTYETYPYQITWQWEISESLLKN